MNRLFRRVNRKNHLNLSIRASIKAARALLPLFAGPKWRIQRGALLLMIFLTGCVSLEKSYPDRRYFALELAPGNVSEFDKRSHPVGGKSAHLAALRR